MGENEKKMLERVTTSLDSISQKQLILEREKRPRVTSNEDFYGDKTHFTFSPNKNLIAFVQDVFEEYGSDFDRSWALKIYNVSTGEEKTLVVDDARMSAYEWLDNSKLRVFHSAGTGVRVYLDIAINQASPLFTKDYEGSKIWTPDMEYVQKGLDVAKARRDYFEKTEQLDE